MLVGQKSSDDFVYWFVPLALIALLFAAAFFVLRKLLTEKASARAMVPVQNQKPVNARMHDIQGVMSLVVSGMDDKDSKNRLLTSENSAEKVLEANSSATDVPNRSNSKREPEFVDFDLEDDPAGIKAEQNSLPPAAESGFELAAPTDAEFESHSAEQVDLFAEIESGSEADLGLSDTAIGIDDVGIEPGPSLADPTASRQQFQPLDGLEFPSHDSSVIDSEDTDQNFDTCLDLRSEVANDERSPLPGRDESSAADLETAMEETSKRTCKEELTGSKIPVGEESPKCTKNEEPEKGLGNKRSSPGSDEESSRLSEKRTDSKVKKLNHDLRKQKRLNADLLDDRSYLQNQWDQSEKARQELDNQLADLLRQNELAKVKVQELEQKLEANRASDDSLGPSENQELKRLREREQKLVAELDQQRAWKLGAENLQAKLESDIEELSTHCLELNAARVELDEMQTLKEAQFEKERMALHTDLQQLRKSYEQLEQIQKSGFEERKVLYRQRAELEDRLQSAQEELERVRSSHIRPENLKPQQSDEGDLRSLGDPESPDHPECPEGRREAQKENQELGTAERSDDLTRIHGIGPKTSQLLKAAGVMSFQDLANADAESIREILANAGSRFKRFDPTNWPKQAEFAASGDWSRLKEWAAKPRS